MALTAGQHLGHYEIRSPLGVGGMGEVYLAEDTRLHRKVALKILPEELASDQSRLRRFNQEATAAAGLNHPHIAHIYEIGNTNSLHFIAMEYIEGETLRDKVRGDKTPLTRLLKYLIQVSPDGQSIACIYETESGALQMKIAIIPTGGGPPAIILENPTERGIVSGGPPTGLLELAERSSLVKWTPDGRAIAYIVTDKEVSNIWAQPLDGGPSKQLTNFQSERIFNFAWSRDGRQLALSRGVANRDVVLITGFK